MQQQQKQEEQEQHQQQEHHKTEEQQEEFHECLEQEEVGIVPFTEGQLHALYHNVELEKNVEFVEHWLETQVSSCSYLLIYLSSYSCPG